MKRDHVLLPLVLVIGITAITLVLYSVTSPVYAQVGRLLHDPLGFLGF